jgi:hypothetical protein
MAELGFFCLTGDRYQMTVPQSIIGSKIEAALLRLAATEDQQHYLHPEQLVTCLGKQDAQNWQLRLERLPWMQRVADLRFFWESLSSKIRHCLQQTLLFGNCLQFADNAGIGSKPRNRAENDEADAGRH